MYDLEFSCANCYFAQMQDGQQVGCKLNRAEKLGYKLTSPYYTLSRFCHTSRTKEWGEESEKIHENDPYGSPEIDVYEEIFPRLGLVIVFNDDMEAFKRTFESAEDFAYTVVVNNKVEYNEEINEVLKGYNGKSYIVQMLVDVPHLHKLDYAFKHAQKGWIVIVPAGYEFNIFFAETFAYEVNNNCKPISLSVDKDKQKMLVSTALYKYLNGNRPKMLNDGTVDQRDFFGKLSDFKQDDPNSVIPWEQLFNEEA